LAALSGFCENVGEINTSKVSKGPGPGENTLDLRRGKKKKKPGHKILQGRVWEQLGIAPDLHIRLGVENFPPDSKAGPHKGAGRGPRKRKGKKGENSFPLKKRTTLCMRSLDQEKRRRREILIKEKEPGSLKKKKISLGRGRMQQPRTNRG